MVEYVGLWALAVPVAAAEVLEDEIAVAITDDSTPVIVAETAEEVAANELVTA